MFILLNHIYIWFKIYIYVFLLLICLVVCVLGIEPMVSPLLGMFSTTLAIPTVLWNFFVGGVVLRFELINLCLLVPCCTG
jgi:hypothetical protein